MTSSIPTDLLDQRLPDWYRALSIELNGELVDARKAAIKDLATAIDHENAAGVIAYAHGRLNHGEALIDWIREVAREHDQAFAGAVRDLEPRVMLACATAHRLATTPEDPVSTRLALLCESAAFRGLRSTAKRQDLAALAARHLRGVADNAGAPPKVAAASALTTVRKHLKALPEFPDDPNAVVTNSVMRTWAESAVEAFETTARRLDSVDRKLARSALLIAERLDQTAWLLEEYCEIAGQPWSEVSKERAPIFAATELAELTSPPGLPTASVMLKSTLLKAGQNPNGQVDCLQSVQRAAPRLDTWPALEGDDLTPLTAAVGAYRELEGKSGWRSLAQTRRGGGDLRAVAAQTLAQQAHRELMIARLSDE